MSELPADLIKTIEEAVERGFYRALQEASGLTGVSKPIYGSEGCGHYYLDEAGDATIFRPGRRKNPEVMIGEEGCSRFFILGLLDVKNPESLDSDLNRLRAELLADPWFSGVPSFHPARRQTSLFFHAKDDLPEVRREVFRLLKSHDLKFSAVVCDKRLVLEQYIVPRQKDEPDYRYNPSHQYDYQVKRLFKGRLHKMATYNIHFAHRGASSRTNALRAALVSTQQEMNEKRNIEEAAKLDIAVHRPWDHGGLQAVDYFLWALQRLYEKDEERFFGLIQDQVSVINEANRKREGHHGGTFYTRQRPLSLAALRADQQV